MLTHPRYVTTPGTHAAKQGHWDKAEIETFLSIQFQNGPLREHGVNGVMIEDVATILIDRLKMLNKTHPCRENAMAIQRFEEGLHWLHARTAARKALGVEGTDQARDPAMGEV